MKRLLLCLALASPLAEAAVLQDPALQRLLEEARSEELLAEARQRSGPEAQAAQALALLQMGEASGIDRAVQLADACAQQAAAPAACHFALGSALALQAERRGLVSAAATAPRVIRALNAALEQQPELAEARATLQVLYLALPSFLGGGSERARRLEHGVPASQPEVLKLLRSRAAGHAGRWDEAERELLALQPGKDRALQNLWLSGWTALARHWNKTNAHAHARERLSALAQSLPGLAQPQYLLARLAGDEGRHEEALRLLDRARTLSGAATLPLDYRTGIAWMDLGDKDKARHYLRRFSDAQRGTRDDLQDAARRLKELG